MLSKLVLVSAAATLILPSTSDACMQMCLTKRHLAAIGAICVVLSPILIPVSIGYGAIKLAVEVKDAAKDAMNPHESGTSVATENTEFWRTRSETAQLKEYFAKADKEPTPSNLFTCGLHFLMADDLSAARMYFRRSIELAKQDPNWEKDMKTLPIVALALYQAGLVKMRVHLFDQALDHFQEAYNIITKNFGTFDESKVSVEDNVLDANEIVREMSWARLHRALYEIDEYFNSGGIDASLRANDLAVAVDELVAQAAAVSSIDDATASKDQLELKYTSLLRGAIAVFYQNANEHSYHWGISRPEPKDVDEARKIAVEDQAARSKAFLENVIPAFEKIIYALVDRGIGSKLNSGDNDSFVGWSHYYLTRCNFVLLNKSVALNHFNQAKRRLGANDVTFNPSHCDPYLDRYNSHTAEDREIEGPFDLSGLASVALGPHSIWTAQKASGTEPHLWEKKTMHRPCVCSTCFKIMGFGTPGYICTCCGYRAHEDCKKQIEEAPCLARNDLSRMDNHQHILRNKTCHRPHWCSFCQKVVLKNALQCEACSIIVHEGCSTRMRNVIIAEAEQK
jgi:tetratricopeptide (TPR) repeat protein